MDDWRTIEILKLIRQCVICPYCGALVATEAGIENHKQWHNGVNAYVADVDDKLQQFSDYITHPETGLQQLFQNRLDTITAYVTAPETGLEPRVTVAIGALSNRVGVIENEITRPSTGLRARLAALEALGLH